MSLDSNTTTDSNSSNRMSNKLGFSMDNILGVDLTVVRRRRKDEEEEENDIKIRASRTPSPILNPNEAAPSPVSGSSVTNRSSCESPIEAVPTASDISNLGSFNMAAYTHAWAAAAAAAATAAQISPLLLQRLSPMGKEKVLGN